MGCTNLSSVKLPENISSIEWATFAGCTSLESIVIPNNVKTIGEGAFSGCTNLTSVILPNNLSSIGAIAFEECSSLTSITIPDKVTTIEMGTFHYCKKLTDITLGRGIKTLCCGSFAFCAQLSNVYCYAKNVPICNNGCASYYGKATGAFEDSYIDYATLHVPTASVDAYKAANTWKNFKSIVEIHAAEHTLTYILDGIEYKSFQVEEGSIIIPEADPIKEGYTFSGWSEIPETMPANEVTVTGLFTVNKYTLTYTVDGETYKTNKVEYGANITPEATPTKKGFTFSGWSETPETMPANDVTVIGTFTINKYKLTYMVDGETYKTYEVEYGANIIPEAEPSKEGYVFSGWSEIPSVMPNYDVTATGRLFTTENLLSIKAKEVCTGISAVLPVELVNKAAISAFEFTVCLPKGVTLSGCELTDRKGRDHTCSSSIQSLGKYKVIAYSGTSKAFSEAEGVVINLMLDVSKEMELGEYMISLKDIELTTTDTEYFFPADVSAKLTVSDILPGDANGDGRVSITDVVAIVNHIIGRTPANFVAAAADVNGDGLINVFDVTKTVNIILGIDGEEAKMRDAVDAIDGMMTMVRKGDGMNLIVEKPSNYIAMQFDVIVPEGSSLQDVKLNGCADHALAFDRTGENRYTVIAYSMNNAAFEAAENALVTLQLSDVKTVSIENAAFVTTDGRCVKMNVSDMETGIQSVDSLHLTVDSDAIYTLSGQRVTMERKALPKGVYIQNGRKFVVK